MDTGQGGSFESGGGGAAPERARGYEWHGWWAVPPVRAQCGSVVCVFVVCVVVVQVALMGVVSGAVAAMDAHQGVASVAGRGVFFLRSLSTTDANTVCVMLQYGQWSGRIG
jgi:hypothetical protein